MHQRAEERTSRKFHYLTLFHIQRPRPLICHALFEDTRGLGYLKLDDPQQVRPVKLKGLHQGIGELDEIEHMRITLSGDVQY